MSVPKARFSEEDARNRPFGDLDDARLGRTLAGRFTLLARLGAGSMGTVYRARQMPVGRDVAIKILRSDRAVDEAAKARFLREARTNSLLTSPHTVTVFDFGQSDEGELYLAMELLEGESLGQRLQQRKRLPIEAAVDVARQALRSLAEAHAKGIVHRDLKPDNIFFSYVPHGGSQAEEIVKVLDFGIAKMLGEGMSALNAVETQAGTVFGTPRYMSPEQAQAKPLDGRSDLYSLGVILYHVLTGRPPFTDDDAVVVMARHIKTTPKPFKEAASDVEIPSEIERVVMRALEKDPAKRPATAEAMSQELLAALEASRAGTSGVRASMGVAPPSKRAEEILGPPSSNRVLTRPRMIGLTAGLSLIAAAALAGIAMRSPAEPHVEKPVTTAAKVEAPPAAAPAAPTTNASGSIPIIDIAELPRTAPPPQPTPSIAPGAKPAAVAAPPKRPKTAPAGSASSSTGRYGILD